MKLLVTGATGFIGTAFLDVAHRYFDGEIHAIGEPSTAAIERKGIAGHTVDLLDNDQVSGLMQTVRPSHLLHLAWIATPGQYATSPQNFNWLSSGLHLLSAFQRSGGQRVVLAGTCMEYDWRYGYCTEDTTPLQFDSPYSACKNALRIASESYSRTHDMECCWGRIFYPYGPGEAAERVIPYVVNSLLRNETAKCSSGMQRLDYVFIEDVAEAFARLISSDCQGAVNIGGGAAIQLRSLLTQVGNMMGRPELIQFEKEERHHDRQVVMASVDKLRRHLDWSPQTSLEQGLSRTIEWWKQRYADSEKTL